MRVLKSYELLVCFNEVSFRIQIHKENFMYEKT